MNSSVIQYYQNKKIPEVLSKRKIQMLENNPDVLSEFEYWLENGTYIETNPVCVEGYTAKSLSSLSKYLKGDDAFVMLIELRNNPDRAKKIIQNGLKNK